MNVLRKQEMALPLMATLPTMPAARSLWLLTRDALGD
jgi:hypothetical protein